MKRDLCIGACCLTAIVTLGIASTVLKKKAVVEAAAVQAPMFEVDPLWPKPLPNHWILGNGIGVSVDGQDHIWILHRPGSLEKMETYATTNPPSAACCVPAPPVLEFDHAGNLIGHWGGPGQGYQWPNGNHGIHIDYKGNVWIGAAGDGDGQVLKFTQAGKFLMQIGHARKSKGSNDVDNLNKPAKMFVDKTSNELYVADGYGNKRVIVYDADTGKYKRHWGAYGHKPDDTDLGPYKPDAPPAQQFRNPVHAVEVSNDGLVYACDRANDRLQVFKKDGAFVKEAFIAKRTLGDGSVWDIAISKDLQQKYMYVADGANEKVYIVLRDTLEVLTSFGDGGRQPGEFYAVHSIATDSKGNIYTTETYHGQRVQRFVYRGMGPVTKMDQGAVWPKAH